MSESDAVTTPASIDMQLPSLSQEENSDIPFDGDKTPRPKSKERRGGNSKAKGFSKMHTIVQEEQKKNG